MLIDQITIPTGRPAWNIRYAGNPKVIFTVLTTYMDARGYARAFSTLGYDR